MRLALLMIWIIGILLCVHFMVALLPMEGWRGHLQIMPLSFTTISILSGGCCVILRCTYLFSIFFRKR
jgi:hypothetical protein